MLRTWGWGCEFCGVAYVVLDRVAEVVDKSNEETVDKFSLYFGAEDADVHPVSVVAGHLDYKIALSQGGRPPSYFPAWADRQTWHSQPLSWRRPDTV